MEVYKKFNSFINIADNNENIKEIIKPKDIIEFTNGENWFLLNKSSKTNCLYFFPLYNISRVCPTISKRCCIEYADRFNDNRIISYNPIFADFEAFNKDKLFAFTIDDTRSNSDFFIWDDYINKIPYNIAILNKESIATYIFSNSKYCAGIRPVIRIKFDNIDEDDKDEEKEELNNLTDHELLVYITEKLNFNNKEN